MKILLLSENQAVINVVNICLDKPDFELFNALLDDGHCDLVIKDVDGDEDLSDFDEDTTLFLLARDKFETFLARNKIKKPFLPSELIKFLEDYEQNLPEISPKMLAKMASLRAQNDDIDTIKNILKDLDDADARDTNTHTLFMDDALSDSDAVGANSAPRGDGDDETGDLDGDADDINAADALGAGADADDVAQNAADKATEAKKEPIDEFAVHSDDVSLEDFARQLEITLGESDDIGAYEPMGEMKFREEDDAREVQELQSALEKAISKCLKEHLGPNLRNFKIHIDIEHKE